MAIREIARKAALHAYIGHDIDGDASGSPSHEVIDAVAVAVLRELKRYAYDGSDFRDLLVMKLQEFKSDSAAPDPLRDLAQAKEELIRLKNAHTPINGRCTYCGQDGGCPEYEILERVLAHLEALSVDRRERQQVTDMPVCVSLARERLSLFVNDSVPISARDLRDMLSAVVVEYEALHSKAVDRRERVIAPQLDSKDKEDYGASLLPVDPSASVSTETLPNTEPSLIVATVCGGKQARICPKTGKEHDMSAAVRFRDGGSVACRDCGVTAMSIDLLELP